MRGLGLVILGACSFSPGKLGVDAPPVTPGDDANLVDALVIDAATDAATDAMLDAMLAGAKVRRIDLDDTKITGAPHTDFPLLVALSETWLRSSGNGGDVARTDGFDIYFSADQLGVMRLAHEVEVYAPTTGTLVAWVKIPLMAATSVLYLHYGDTTITTSQADSTGVWTGGYQLVLHLDGGGDSTAKNLSSSSANVTAATGKFDEGRGFNGTSSYINLNSNTAIDDVFVGGGTADGWFYADTFGEGSFGRMFDKDQWGFGLDNGDVVNGLSFFHAGSSGYGEWEAAANITLGAWHHLVAVYNQDSDANDAQVYLDGVAIVLTQVDTANGTASDASSDLYIGNRQAVDRTFDGVLDELRLSSLSRTSGWIGTQYRNQSDPSMFYSVSAPL